jgi:hypothetical protein
VRFLLEIALCVNTTRPSSLPAYVTPFDVWFGREPHFLRARPLNSDNKPCDADGNELVFAAGEVDTSASDGGYPDPNAEEDEEPAIELEKWILNAIELRIRKNNVLVARRMVKKGAKKARVFKEGSVVTLAIPSKMRRTTEPKRLPVRILSINKHSYTLMSRFGRLKGAFQAGQLNAVESKTLGLDIAVRWPATGPKILLTQAVQLFNGRGTLASIQKAGRDIVADQAKADKLVVEALDSVAKWVAKLPLAPLETPAPRAAPASLVPELGPASPTPEVEALPPRRGPRQGTKGLFVWSTLVPLTVNGTNIVKTPNTQSIVGTLILRNIEISTVPLTFCMVMDQIDKKVNLIKINCQAIDFATTRSCKISLNDLQHHQRI